MKISLGEIIMPKYVEGVELTQEGMHAIFARMGYGNITSGSFTMECQLLTQ